MPPRVELKRENFKLISEEGGRARNGELVIRALHNFNFYKAGKLVSPFPDDCTPEFWKGCNFTGAVASLTGASRHIIQAGYWDVNYADHHYVTMTVTDIVGLHADRSKAWRNKDYALMVETKGYVYVLLSPALPYADDWKRVLRAWEKYSMVRLAYAPIDVAAGKPRWWTTNRDWEALTAAYEEAMREERAAKRAEKAARKTKATEKIRAPKPSVSRQTCASSSKAVSAPMEQEEEEESEEESEEKEESEEEEEKEQDTEKEEEQDTETEKEDTEKEEEEDTDSDKEKSTEPGEEVEVEEEDAKMDEDEEEQGDEEMQDADGHTGGGGAGKGRAETARSESKRIPKSKKATGEGQRPRPGSPTKLRKAAQASKAAKMAQMAQVAKAMIAAKAAREAKAAATAEGSGDLPDANLDNATDKGKGKVPETGGSRPASPPKSIYPWGRYDKNGRRTKQGVESRRSISNPNPEHSLMSLTIARDEAKRTKNSPRRKGAKMLGKKATSPKEPQNTSPSPLSPPFTQRFPTDDASPEGSANKKLPVADAQSERMDMSEDDNADNAGSKLRRVSFETPAQNPDAEPERPTHHASPSSSTRAPPSPPAHATPSPPAPTPTSAPNPSPRAKTPGVIPPPEVAAGTSATGPSTTVAEATITAPEAAPPATQASVDAEPGPDERKKHLERTLDFSMAPSRPAAAAVPDQS